MTAVPCHRIRSQAAPVMNMLLPLTSRWTIRSLCTCFKAMQSCVTQFFTLPMGSSKSFLAPPAPPGPRVYRWTQPTSANLDLANLANLKIYPPFLSHHWWDMYRFYKYVYIYRYVVWLRWVETRAFEAQGENNSIQFHDNKTLRWSCHIHPYTRITAEVSTNSNKPNVFPCAFPRSLATCQLPLEVSEWLLRPRVSRQVSISVCTSPPG